MAAPTVTLPSTAASKVYKPHTLSFAGEGLPT
jgi:hypothetical protein